jgi:hypothetical protein
MAVSHGQVGSVPERWQRQIAFLVGNANAVSLHEKLNHYMNLVGPEDRQPVDQPKANAAVYGTRRSWASPRLEGGQVLLMTSQNACRILDAIQIIVQFCKIGGPTSSSYRFGFVMVSQDSQSLYH